MRLLKKRIGERLKKLRQEWGYKSQNEFANALGVEQSTVARWESGKFTPQDTQLARISELLRIPKEMLLNDEIPSNQQKDLERGHRLVHKVLDDKQELVEKIDTLERRLRTLEGAKTLENDRTPSDLQRAFDKASSAVQEVVLALLVDEPADLRQSSREELTSALMKLQPLLKKR